MEAHGECGGGDRADVDFQPDQLPYAAGASALFVWDQHLSAAGDDLFWEADFGGPPVAGGGWTKRTSVGIRQDCGDLTGGVVSGGVADEASGAAGPVETDCLGTGAILAGAQAAGHGHGPHVSSSAGGGNSAGGATVATCGGGGGGDIHVAGLFLVCRRGWLSEGPDPDVYRSGPGSAGERLSGFAVAHCGGQRGRMGARGDARVTNAAQIFANCAHGFYFFDIRGRTRFRRGDNRARIVLSATCTDCAKRADGP